MILAAGPLAVSVTAASTFAVSNAGVTGLSVASNFKFPGGNAPTRSTTSGQTDIITCVAMASGTAILHCTAALSSYGTCHPSPPPTMYSRLVNQTGPP